MLRKKYFIFLFCLISGLSQISLAQELFRSTKWISQTIRAKSFQKNSFGHQMFSYLAVNSNKHIDQLSIDFEAYLFTTIVRDDDERVTVFVKFFNPIAKGSVQFRNFQIDTLMLPAVFNGVVDLYADENKIYTAPIMMIDNGGYISVDLRETGAKIKADIRIESIEFTEENYLELVNIGGLINYYYSYDQILEQLVNRIQKENIVRSSSPSEIFNNWHEINRVNNYVESHDFVKKLNLSAADPSKIIDIFEKTVRLERRHLTLYNQILESPRKSSIVDKHLFAENYALLSQKYLEEAGNNQLYLATGYNEVVRIFPDSVEIKNIAGAADYYDVFNLIEDGSTPQLIYDQFLKLAQQSFDNGKDIASLDFLYNAKVIAENIDKITRSDQYNKLFTKTLESLMGSYLQVAIMSYRSGNFSMAEAYSDKALEIFDDSKKELNEFTLSTDAFFNFNKQQIDLAKSFLSDKKYRQSIKILDNASEISSLRPDNPEKGGIDSVYFIAYNRLYNSILDSIALLPADRNSEEKLQSLETTRIFAEKHSEFIINPENATVNLLASTLFTSFYQNGQDLLLQDEPGDALKSLQKAKYINESYFHAFDSQLDTLIYSATVPVILDIIQKAEFETWANRLKNAEKLFLQAKKMQVDYQQQDQPELVAAFADLRVKIDNRTCASVQFTIDDKAKIIQNRILSKKYDEAFAEYKKTMSVLNEKTICQIYRQNVDSVVNSNINLFLFLEKKSVLQKLAADDKYEQEIGNYIQLTDYFSSTIENRYQINLLSLPQYIDQRNKIDLTVAAINYYLSDSDYDSAFLYLKLLRKQKVPSKNTKDFQLIIGKGLAAGKKNGEKIDVEKYTVGDEWFKYFRSAYQGSLLRI